MQRPRFSLITLILASLTCGAAMLLYRNYHPWHVERVLRAALMEGSWKDQSGRPVEYAPGPDGWVAKISQHSELILFNVRRNQREIPITVREGLSIVGCEFLADRRHLAIIEDEEIAGEDRPGRRHFVTIWNLAEQKLVERRKLDGIFASSARFALSSNGRYLIERTNLVIWDRATGKRVLQFLNFGEDAQTHIWPEEKQEQARLALEQAPAAMDLFQFHAAVRGKSKDFSASEEPSPEKILKGSYPNAPLLFKAVAYDGALIALAMEGDTKVYLFDGATLERKTVLYVPHKIRALTLSDNGQLFACITTANQVEVRDVASGELLQSLPAPLVERRDRSAPTFQREIFSIQFLHDSLLKAEDRMQYRGGSESRFETWNWRTAQALPVSAQTIHILPQHDLHFAWMSKVYHYRESLFDFKQEALWVDAETSRVFTYKEGENVSQWTRRRPEQWWGLFYIYETYLLAILAAVTVWTVFRKRHTQSS